MRDFSFTLLTKHPVHVSLSGMNVSNAQVGVKPHLALKTRETRHSIMMRLPATWFIT